MGSLKLSELNDDVEVFREGDRTVYEVSRLKHEILECEANHHEYGGWYTVEERQWKPDAESMLTDYIVGHYENGDMYEDWDEYALSCLTKDGIKKVQESLEELFRDSGITQYYEPANAVEIDVYPK